MDKVIRAGFHLNSAQLVALAYCIAAIAVGAYLSMYSVALYSALACIIIIAISLFSYNKAGIALETQRLAAICSSTQSYLGSGFGLSKAMRSALHSSVQNGLSYAYFYEALSLIESGLAPSEAFDEIAGRASNKEISKSIRRISSNLLISYEDGFGRAGEELLAEFSKKASSGKSSFEKASVLSIFSGTVLPSVVAFSFIGYSIAGVASQYYLPPLIDCAVPVAYAASTFWMLKSYWGI
ncbi:MAG: hypothetical protein QXN59_02945 [Candidatus Micrarchaeaceae archaeon]